MKARFVIVVAALAAACSSLHPVAIQAGDRCFRCRQTIVETRLAAELIDHYGAPFPFRTSGCLAKHVKANPGDKILTFVTDFPSGRMIPAADAWFVPVSLTNPERRFPEADYQAYKSRAAAEADKPAGAALLRWDAVVAAVPVN
jgi:hypothetical protein